MSNFFFAFSGWGGDDRGDRGGHRGGWRGGKRGRGGNRNDNPLDRGNRSHGHQDVYYS